MRLIYAALGTLLAGAGLSLAVLMTNDVARWAVPGVVTVLVIVFSVGLARLVKGRLTVLLIAVIAAVGMISTWLLALLPEDTRFSGNYSFEMARPDLWMAPVAITLSLGLIALFVTELIAGPQNGNRPPRLGLAIVSISIMAATGLWSLIARMDVDRILRYAGYGAEIEATQQVGGLNWLAFTALIGVMVAGVVSLFPIQRFLASALGIVAGIAATTALQLPHPLVLSVPTVIASGIGALMVVLVHHMVYVLGRRTTAELQSLGAPPIEIRDAPVSAIAVGMVPVLGLGILLYFTVWVVPALI
ncbi:hypothetical protein QDX25_12165 [Auritidibacter ignavus]|uniref:hypothetical protein n=1 Tax=Auritidibacter TaxID=1160973 RepID=UPI00143D4D69|nr:MULTISPECIES: hypothetical protein [Auritidibacter]WGH81517.1 hypothetical protein QDX25_12165 [Auritidibacter ignavus]